MVLHGVSALRLGDLPRRRLHPKSGEESNSCSSAFCIACLHLYAIAPVCHRELDHAVCDHLGVKTLVYADGTQRERSR